jgi:hypothetical protein
MAKFYQKQKQVKKGLIYDGKQEDTPAEVVALMQTATEWKMYDAVLYSLSPIFILVVLGFELRVS